MVPGKKTKQAEDRVGPAEAQPAAQRPLSERPCPPMPSTEGQLTLKTHCLCDASLPAVFNCAHDTCMTKFSATTCMRCMCGPEP